jgi:Sec-independent protein secretion pathway component TatC
MMNRKFIFDAYSVGIFVLGLIFLVIGYIVMATGDTVFSPIILVIAYVVLFPLSIVLGLARGEKEGKESQE